MKKFAILLLLIFAIGCGPSIKFLKTGKTYPPLPDNIDVIVYVEEKPKDYETIGFAKISGPEFQFDELTINIKKKARAVGGNIVILEKKTMLVVAFTGNAAALIYEFRFRIAKTKTTQIDI